VGAEVVAIEEGARLSICSAAKRADRTSPRRLRAGSLLLVGIISLVASGCGLAGAGSSSDGQAPVTLTRLHSQCDDQRVPVYELGGTLPGSLFGNAKPVDIVVNVGERFAIWAQFNESQMAAFKVIPVALQALCQVYTTGKGGGPAVIFEAHKVGHFVVQTQDVGDNCIGACPAILGFEADVTVVQNSNENAAS
jgi:hypothetical protein